MKKLDAHSRNSRGADIWHEYDSEGRETLCRDSEGRVVYSRSSRGFEIWHEYDSEGREIRYRDSGGCSLRFEYGGAYGKIAVIDETDA